MPTAYPPRIPARQAGSPRNGRCPIPAPKHRTPRLTPPAAPPSAPRRPTSRTTLKKFSL